MSEEFLRLNGRTAFSQYVWTLHGTDENNVYWRRIGAVDGRPGDDYVIGFNKVGVGEPCSTEDEPPAEIDQHAAPMN